MFFFRDVLSRNILCRRREMPKTAKIIGGSVKSRGQSSGTTAEKGKDYLPSAYLCCPKCQMLMRGFTMIAPRSLHECSRSASRSSHENGQKCQKMEKSQHIRKRKQARLVNESSPPIQDKEARIHVPCACKWDQKPIQEHDTFPRDYTLPRTPYHMGSFEVSSLKYGD